MKKIVVRLLLLSLVAGFICGCSGTDDKKENSKVEIINPEKIYVCLYQYDMKNSNIEKCYSYNELGFLQYKIEYNSDGEKLSVEELNYDELGNISDYVLWDYSYDTSMTDDEAFLKRLEYQYDVENAIQIVQREYAYDTKNKKIAFDVQNGTNLVTKISQYNISEEKTAQAAVTYDNQGNIISIVSTEYVEEGEETTYTEYMRKYDEQGNLISEITYINDKFSSYYTYVYDSARNITSEVYHKEDGTISGYAIYKYDSNGNLIEDISYNGDGEITWEILYDYDEKGNQIKKEVIPVNVSLNAGSHWWEIYEYDENDNLIRITQYNSDGISSTDEFEYNENGNVIRYKGYAKDGRLVWDYFYRYVPLADYLENKETYEQEIEDCWTTGNIDLGKETEKETEEIIDEEIVTQENSVEALAREYYGEFLAYYRDYEASGFDGRAEAINLIYSEYGFSGELYYTVIDLANDGVPELFIADEDGIIYDSYALTESDGQVWVLVEAEGALLGDRIQCTICENNMLKIVSNGGANYGGVDFYRLYEHDYYLSFIEGCYYEEDAYYYGTEERTEMDAIGYIDEKSITSEDYWNVYYNKYSEKTDIQWHKLSEFTHIE